MGKIKPSGSQRVALREQSSTDPTGQVSYLLSNHLGSTTALVSPNGVILSAQRYASWGQTLSGGVSTAYQYTGQRNTGLGIYYYNARFYDGALGRFLTPDSIIPQPGNPQDWDRYSYVRNNPINAIDPSGHRPCDGGGADRECDPSSLIDYRSEWKENQKVPLPAPPTPYVFEGGCSGTNPSVVCKDPTLITSGQVETNTVYPVLKIPGDYEGPFIDEGCKVSPLCWLLVGADIVNFFQYQTN